MTSGCNVAREVASVLAACALVISTFTGANAQAKNRSLRDELERSLVGQVVTPRFMVGDTGRWSEEGHSAVLPVHTVVYPQTGEIAYLIEWKFLGADIVPPGEMQGYYASGTSFRISGIHFKPDRVELKLKELHGRRSTEVKVVLGPSWQSTRDWTAVREALERVFTFGQPAQREMEAEQAPPQERPVETPTQSQVPAAQVETATQPTTPATPIAAVAPPANQDSVPPNPPQQPEQRGPATLESARPAFIDCKAVQQIALFSLPDASSSPVAMVQCGEKVVALGQQRDWTKVRTQGGVEGYALGGYVSYGETPSSGQAAEGQREPSPSAAPTPNAIGEQSRPPQGAEQQALASPGLASAPDDSGSWYQWALAGLLLLVLVGVALLISLAGLRGSDSEVVHAVLECPVAIISIGLAIGPIGYFVTDNDTWGHCSVFLLVLTFLLVLRYAYLYTLITIIPFAIIYGIFDTPGVYWRGDERLRLIFWLWLWNLPPLAYIISDKVIRHFDEQKEEEERREAIAREAQERMEAEREERRRKNQEEQERASAQRKYGDVVAAFRELVATCGSQADEIMRASKAIDGGDFGGITATEVIVADVLLILGVISRAKGEVPIGLGRLCQAIYGSLNFETDIAVERHNAKIEAVRHGSRAVSLPGMVTLLEMYDQIQRTSLAAKAAQAYWTLICAACEAVDSKLGVATKLVQAKYLEFLGPYLTGTGGNGNGGQQSRSNGTPETDRSSFPGCGECPKYYQVLRISPGATKEEIKTAYRSLAKIYHSDYHHGKEDGVRRTADDLFRDLKEAYDHFASHWSP